MADFSPNEGEFFPSGYDDYEDKSSNASITSSNNNDNDDTASNGNEGANEQDTVDKTISQDQTDQQEISVLHISGVDTVPGYSDGYSKSSALQPQFRAIRSRGGTRNPHLPDDTDSEASSQPKGNGVDSIKLISDVVARFINGHGTHTDGAGPPQVASSDSAGSGNPFQHPFIEFLLKSLASLSSENAELRKRLEESHTAANPVADLEASNRSVAQMTAGAQQSATKVNLVFNNAHLVLCQGSTNSFLDIPRLFKGDTRSDHLRGRRGVEYPTTYLELNPHFAFLVVAEYHCFCQRGPNLFRLVGYKDGKMVQDSPNAKKVRTSIFLGKSLNQALLTMISENKTRFPGISNNFISHVFHAPYFLFYLHTETFKDLVDSTDITDKDKEGVRALCTWFEENCKEDWEEANELLSRGKINSKHLKKLFRPEELVVEPRKDDQFLVEVYKTKTYPWSHDSQNFVDIHSWVFNGSFRYNYSRIVVGGNNPMVQEKDGIVDIISLYKYPLRFAMEGLHQKLIARGNKFWHYRKPSLATLLNFQAGGNGKIQDTREHRYMIDYNIFRSIHPFNSIFEESTDDLGIEAMDKNEPPDDDFLAMMPPRIHAFDLANKAWKNVRVDQLTTVTWNKESFSRLVIPSDTKELIQAAITSHGNHPSAAPDIISDKGQGLLILLHGGPGTGKTLTAESIAEQQGRPLYRVTCGDIGVEPIEVEKYLKSVFVIGKAWGCVVLLDEADVFLEERSTNDPKQNAIVSSKHAMTPIIQKDTNDHIVFLRVLEYYDGIMILTTNRVGTFDEAFKSRIHLAVRYADLDEDQRVEIWRNFIHLLAHSKERVDIDDLNLNVNKVAQYSLNGRQIRNVVTLARYLARFRKEMLVYKHVQDALASIMKFDKYLEEVRGSDELFARQQRIR